MTTTDTVVHDVERASVARPRLRAPRAAGLRAGAAHQAGQGRRRHQVVPLPRPRVDCSSARRRCGTRNIGMGTVTHQNIGYLFPMGPYYWLMHELGVPAWVSQRLWFGSMLFGAALGVLFLLRTLQRARPGSRSCAACVFMLTPYTLDFASRISVILLPWAGLPWMLALTIRALRARDERERVAVRGDLRHRRADRRRSERDRARVRGHRAGAVDRLRGRWSREVDCATRARRDRAHRRAHAWSRRCGGSRASGRRASYGLNILKFTETLQVVSVSSTAERGAPRARVLVLLRHRPHRALDRRQRPVHAEPRAARGQLRPARSWRSSAPRACGGGTARTSWCSPWSASWWRWARTPTTIRRPLGGTVQVVRGVVELRARVAQHEPGGAAGRARAGGAARRGGERARRALGRDGAPRCAGVPVRDVRGGGRGDRAGDRQPARALDRRLLHRRTSPATRRSRSTGPTPSPRSTRSRTTPGCSRSPAPTSPPTGGVRPSTRSRPGSWTGRTWRGSWCRGGRRRRPTCSTRSTSACRRATLDADALAPHRPADRRGRDRLPRRPADRPLQPGALDPAVAVPHRSGADRAGRTRRRFGDQPRSAVARPDRRRAPARSARRRRRNRRR